MIFSKDWNLSNLYFLYTLHSVQILPKIDLFFYKSTSHICIIKSNFLLSKFLIQKRLIFKKLSTQWYMKPKIWKYLVAIKENIYFSIVRHYCDNEKWCYELVQLYDTCYEIHKIKWLMSFINFHVSGSMWILYILW